MAEALKGLGVSSGRAAGRVCRMAGPPELPPRHPVADTDAELGLALDALRATAAELAERAEKAPDAEAQAILEAQSFIADDPGLHESVETSVRAGADAAHAIDEACAHHRHALLAAGGYIAERAADLDDIRNRAVAAVLGLPVPGVPTPGHPFVLVAEDLSPADTVNLDPDTVLALVTEKGGPTSHTAILARARGLPAVVACRGMSEVDEGTWVSVDGLRGEVEVGIGEEAATEIQRLAEAERRRKSTSRGPGRTSDGHPVKLLLNVGSAADLTPQGVDAEGVGLFRTEFLFLDRREEPGYEEQVAAYAAVFRAVPGGHVVVRTLDAGTDKPLPFLGLADETNPALGIRGLRVSRVRPEVLDTQLDAIAEAARQSGAEPWVMAPMVTTAGEAADFAGRARARGITRVGAMVEVPAAALHAGRLLKELDFLSIGTNDLSQYTFASDRQHGDLADLLDPWQAALLQLIADCAAAGQSVGKPVGVCGEAAADPLLATVLVGLGVTSLSMSAPSVPAVRESLAAHSLAQCRDNAQIALGSDDPEQARKLIVPGW
ncbi:phosphoenolpyruvate--protein phosphotransferase [Streptosporangium sp. NBC_01755]|uniref:phosphoenolpyruvate--protein phosphotransferase n=1 Tax=unclassified Streptosporangium TaxID=2632669 RepID=UPI002DDBEA9E|nr:MULTISPECIES: phosphoenolpyruvate--protein phosphotransferase [unclassified Streptosporangium]WSA29033.1 phosphoenolpyruvate--protein phosphotransferase [Streptosporangium sp. NBC_01810]WSC99520.1 phosphoenolpyruvate--protein phosphotransferase [Streptosporangium sp. NBC_01755]